ncbi:hypothetical protein B296_00020383 [Ensete ventricosum]|uniref:Retrotransposon gag domain-containing protein n=1 Tax=Ensete ventricosum TaxID=4639 RepID=A0A426Y1G8_ENSVE|nr:hypothetical protein B296_00020383 [Ensete ventricosum]
MSPERPFENSGTEHHLESDHPRPTEEAMVAVPTPNRFWRMMTDLGFPSFASNPAPFIVTAEAFLGLTNQVQALAEMVHTIVPYLPQLVHSMAHQSAPPTAPPQTESPAAPNRGILPDVEPPQPQVTKARVASPTPMPARSQSRSYNLLPTELDFDTLSTDTADSLREQVRRVHQRLDEVQKEVLKSREEVGESSKGGSPFTPEMQAKPLPATFRLPALEPCDGSGDPTEHIATFHAQMTLYDTSEVLMCRAFPTTLRGSARAWYSRLKPASIPSFDLLEREFELNFLASARPRPTTASLLGMVQGSDEPLSQFVGRFTSQVRGIPDLHLSLAIQAFLMGLRPSKFFWSLIERPPVTLPEMLQRAHQYMAAETLIAGKRDETKHPRGEQSLGHPALPPKRREDRSGLLPARPLLIPLNSTRIENFFQIREKGLLKAPSPMKSHPERHDKRRYYRFHREYGHDTEDCRDLQYQIEDLIRRGHLR